MRTILLAAMTAMAVGCHSSKHGLLRAPQDSLEVIPPAWIDLPDAPFVARLVGGKALLVNRTERAFDHVSVGCVRQNGALVRVVGGLFGMSVDDSTWRRGSHVDGLLRMVNNIDYYVANQMKIIGRDDLIKHCPPDSKIALIAAGLRDHHQWSADGTRWPSSAEPGEQSRSIR